MQWNELTITEKIPYIKVFGKLIQISIEEATQINATTVIWL